MERAKELNIRKKPPLTQPNGWEKTTCSIDVGCTQSEKALWQMVFGKGKLSETARELLNRRAHAKAKIPWRNVKPG
jgi:hypothetical protein